MVDPLQKYQKTTNLFPLAPQQLKAFLENFRDSYFALNRRS